VNKPSQSDEHDILTVSKGSTISALNRSNMNRSVHYHPQKSGSAIVPDTYPSFGWHPQHTTVFNVHMLNSEGACDLFGQFSPDLGEDGCADVMTSNTPVMPFRTAVRPVSPQTRNTIF
jgi:hypothetical protein